MIAGGARPKGEDFEFAEQIKSETPDNVTVTGVVDDDYWTALKVPDLAVLPYRVVTQSGTFNACATQKRPILASDAEYFKRIVSTWGTPETVDISDVDEVAKRIRQLLQDDSRRTCLAETTAQYKRVNSFEQVGIDHYRIYRQMENSTKSGPEQSSDSRQLPGHLLPVARSSPFRPTDRRLRFTRRVTTETSHPSGRAYGRGADRRIAETPLFA